MKNSILSIVNRKYKKSRLFFQLLSVLFIFVWTSCRPTSNQIGPPVTSITYTDTDMKPIDNIFRHNIATAKLKTVSAGINDLTIDIPSIEKTIIFQLPIQPVKLSIPSLLFAELKLNKLRFKGVRTHWDGTRKALRLRFRFFNKSRGVIGYYKVGFIRKDISLKVKDAVLDLFIAPRVESGKLTFAPLEVELSFYEGNIPAIIEHILYKQIDKAIEKSKKLLQPQFETQIPLLVAMTNSLFVSETKFEDIRISEGEATLTVRY